MARINDEFGQKLKALRKQLKWSQEKLGEAANLHPTYIGGLERGESSASLESIEKLAAAFGLSIAELFDFTDSKRIDHNRAQSELLLLIHQQNPETCELLLEFAKSLDSWNAKQQKKRGSKK